MASFHGMKNSDYYVAGGVTTMDDVFTKKMDDEMIKLACMERPTHISNLYLWVTKYFNKQ